MAAKLKKRALAEYESQVKMEEDNNRGEIKQELATAKPEPSASAPSASKKVKLSLARSASSHDHEGSGRDPLPLSTAHKSGEVAAVLATFQARLPSLPKRDLAEAAKRLCEVTTAAGVYDDGTKVQMCLSLGALLDEGGERAQTEEVQSAVRDSVEKWISALKSEKAPKLVAAHLGLIVMVYRHDLYLCAATHEKIREVAADKLKTPHHSVTVNALKVLGHCISHLANKDVASKTLSLVGKFTASSDPRVRHAAFDTLLVIHEKGRKLNVSMYKQFCEALTDDFDGVRQAALKLVHVMGQTYPDERVKVKGSGAARDTVRMVDDAFGKICNAINDLAVQVRNLAAELIGTMTEVSQLFLEQTLDKKLMSNMRLKKSAHEREAKMVSSGEWSSGKKWADDAPKEELDADTIHLMTFGACGAFIHGLEDEFFAVRSAAIESLTQLSIRNPKLACLALDFLVDMFNDEIELVRLKAIESLKRIASHISLQVHQLETILSALDDYSIVVREKLHLMLQSSTIATKDGLQRVINKLLENLKKYPQDKRSILAVFKKLGERHPDLTLPLVTQLLEIHPFLDTTEPDIDDPAYLCVLVLIFNAAQHCPTLEPLLDQHTKRHYHFLVDTYPHFMPAKKQEEEQKNLNRSNTERFLQQTLARVRGSEHLTMSNRIKLLSRAKEDLKRLGSIEPTLSDTAKFAELYIECQNLFLKTLTTRFWTNPHALSLQQIEIVETNIACLFSTSSQLQNKFTNLSKRQLEQVALLKICVLALNIVFLVRASNRSALSTAEQFLSQVDALTSSVSDETVLASPFLSNLVQQLSSTEDHKPGAMVHILHPLLLAYPLESLDLESPFQIAMSHAVIFEPQGMNETPLKYTAGMVLAVPVDCEVHNIKNPTAVRIAIKTPDQKVQLVTPKPLHFFAKDDKPDSYRLLTDALMSHQVWSEALHVEISVVLDLGEGKKADSSVHISDPVKVYVLPKAVKRGI